MGHIDRSLREFRREIRVHEHHTRCMIRPRLDPARPEDSPKSMENGIKASICNQSRLMESTHFMDLPHGVRGGAAGPVGVLPRAAQACASATVMRVAAPAHGARLAEYQVADG
jgi:hypothetical protein